MEGIIVGYYDEVYRGVICFPIKSEKDLFDAGNIIRLIEEHQSENIADLHEIVQNRGFI